MGSFVLANGNQSVLNLIARGLFCVLLEATRKRREETCAATQVLASTPLQIGSVDTAY